MEQLSAILPNTTPRGIPKGIPDGLVNLGITVTWAHVLEQAIDDLIKESSPLRERNSALYWFTKDSEMEYAFEFELLCALSGLSSERIVTGMAEELSRRKDEWSQKASVQLRKWLSARSSE